MQGQTSEQTTYIKGKRQRTEMMNGAMITVQQCDLRRDLQISSGTVSAVAAHVASTAGYTAETVSTNVKSKDELTLDLKLESPGGAAPALARQFRAKARSNGEDIISPVVEQAAQAIMGAATQVN